MSAYAKVLLTEDALYVGPNMGNWSAKVNQWALDNSADPASGMYFIADVVVVNKSTLLGTTGVGYAYLANDAAGDAPLILPAARDGVTPVSVVGVDAIADPSLDQAALLTANTTPGNPAPSGGLCAEFATLGFDVCGNVETAVVVGAIFLLLVIAVYAEVKKRG